jgi:hypothetical protein
MCYRTILQPNVGEAYIVARILHGIKDVYHGEDWGGLRRSSVRQ